MRPRQGDAGCVLIKSKFLRVDLFNYIKIVVEAFRLIRHFTEHVREVDLVQGEHFADDVEHPISKCVPHSVQFAQEPLQDAPFDDRLTILRGSRNEVERVHVAGLSDAVDTTQTLLETGRIPGQVVIDHQVAKLKVDNPRRPPRSPRRSDGSPGSSPGLAYARAGSSRRGSRRSSIPTFRCSRVDGSACPGAR